MRRKLSIAINSGETTCASKPGKFCPYVGRTNFGSTYVCMLFPAKDGLGAHAELEDNADGWLQRLPQCIEAEKASK